MKWIGLTGGIASGKSTVTQILRDLAYPIVDADLIAHQVVEVGSAGLQSVVQVFGKDILASDGRLDRRRLGQKVFGQAGELAKLNGLLHPLIRAEVARQRAQLHGQGVELAFYDVPLLFESKMEADFDAVVVVSSTAVLQAARLRTRNQLTEEEIERRLASQLPLADKGKLAHFVIHNDEGLDKLKRETLSMLSFVKALRA